MTTTTNKTPRRQSAPPPGDLAKKKVRRAPGEISQNGKRRTTRKGEREPRPSRPTRATKREPIEGRMKGDTLRFDTPRAESFEPSHPEDLDIEPDPDADDRAEGPVPPPTRDLAKLASRRQRAAEEAAKPGKERRWPHEWVDIRLLAPADYNPRIMPEHEDEALGRSLEKFGQLEPIVVNTYPAREGVIVGGHQRVRNQARQGWPETEVVWVYLDPIDEKEANIALNRIHGEWDLPRLAAVIDDIRHEDGDLDVTGMTDEELDELDRLSEEQKDEDRTAEEDEDFDPTPHAGPTRVQRGDLWALGDHRLVCGDSTDPAVWGQLLMGDGGRAHILFTSPPYNVGVSSTRLSLNRSTGNSKYVGETQNDEIDPQAYLHLLGGFLTCALDHVDYAYVDLQSLQRNKVTLLEWQYAFRHRWADILIWDKMVSQPSMDARVLDCQIEEIFIFSDKKQPNRATGHRAFRGGVPNIYQGPPQRNNEFHELHAATFPVHLPTYIVKTFTRPGQVVVDCFAGTGTTMVACQEMARPCRLIELEPQYCDVILRRAEESLGLVPVLLQRAGKATSGTPSSEYAVTEVHLDPLDPDAADGWDDSVWPALPGAEVR